MRGDTRKNLEHGKPNEEFDLRPSGERSGARRLRSVAAPDSFLAKPEGQPSLTPDRNEWRLEFQTGVARRIFSTPGGPYQVSFLS